MLLPAFPRLGVGEGVGELLQRAAIRVNYQQKRLLMIPGLRQALVLLAPVPIWRAKPTRKTKNRKPKTTNRKLKIRTLKTGKLEVRNRTNSKPGTGQTGQTVTNSLLYPSRIASVACRMTTYSSASDCGLAWDTRSARNARCASVSSGSTSHDDAGSSSAAPWNALM